MTANRRIRFGQGWRRLVETQALRGTLQPPSSHRQGQTAVRKGSKKTSEKRVGTLQRTTTTFDKANQVGLDIRLKRTSHPIEVRKTIFDKIKSERMTKAQRERDEGDAISRMIRKRADAEAERIRNEATQAKRLREEEGKVEAGEIRLKAYSQDREFAEKLIQMTKMLEALNPSKSVILVSMRELFWKQMRGPNGPPPPSKGTGESSAGGP